jgi:hypothetical protein
VRDENSSFQDVSVGNTRVRDANIAARGRVREGSKKDLERPFAEVAQSTTDAAKATSLVWQLVRTMQTGALASAGLVTGPGGDKVSGGLDRTVRFMKTQESTIVPIMDQAVQSYLEAPTGRDIRRPEFNNPVLKEAMQRLRRSGNPRDKELAEEFDISFPASMAMASGVVKAAVANAGDFRSSVDGEGVSQVDPEHVLNLHRFVFQDSGLRVRHKSPVSGGGRYGVVTGFCWDDKDSGQTKVCGIHLPPGQFSRASADDVNEVMPVVILDAYLTTDKDGEGLGNREVGETQGIVDFLNTQLAGKGEGGEDLLVSPADFVGGAIDSEVLEMLDKAGVRPLMGFVHGDDILPQAVQDLGGERALPAKLVKQALEAELPTYQAMAAATDEAVKKAKAAREAELKSPEYADTIRKNAEGNADYIAGKINLAASEKRLIMSQLEMKRADIEIAFGRATMSLAIEAGKYLRSVSNIAASVVPSPFLDVPAKIEACLKENGYKFGNNRNMEIEIDRCFNRAVANAESTTGLSNEDGAMNRYIKSMKGAMGNALNTIAKHMPGQYAEAAKTILGPEAQEAMEARFRVAYSQFVEPGEAMEKAKREAMADAMTLAFIAVKREGVNPAADIRIIRERMRVIFGAQAETYGVPVTKWDDEKEEEVTTTKPMEERVKRIQDKIMDMLAMDADGNYRDPILRGAIDLNARSKVFSSDTRERGVQSVAADRIRETMRFIGSITQMLDRLHLDPDYLTRYATAFGQISRKDRFASPAPIFPVTPPSPMPPRRPMILSTKLTGGDDSFVNVPLVKRFDGMFTLGKPVKLSQIEHRRSIVDANQQDTRFVAGRLPIQPGKELALHEKHGIPNILVAANAVKMDANTSIVGVVTGNGRIADLLGINLGGFFYPESRAAEKACFTDVNVKTKKKLKEGLCFHLPSNNDAEPSLYFTANKDGVRKLDAFLDERIANSGLKRVDFDAATAFRTTLVNHASWVIDEYTAKKSAGVPFQDVRLAGSVEFTPSICCIAPITTEARQGEGSPEAVDGFKRIFTLLNKLGATVDPMIVLHENETTSGQAE